MGAEAMFALLCTVMTQSAQHSHALRAALGNCRNGFLAVVLFSLCINVLMLAAPVYMLQVFDRVLSSQSTETLLFLTLMAGIAFLALAALEAVRNSIMVKLGLWLDRFLGGKILSGSVTAALQRGSDPSVQGLRDLATFRTFLTGASIFPILDAPWTPIYLAVIFMLHPALGWLSLGGALVLFSFAVINELSTRRFLQQSAGASVAALRQAESAVQNADVVAAMGMIGNLVNRWNERNDSGLDLQARASARSGRITAMSKFTRQFLQVGILGGGAWLTMQGELTPGAMIACSILMGRALAPVDQAIGSWKSAVGARDAYGRVREQLDTIGNPEEPMRLPAPEGRLDVEGLTFAHPGATEALFRNVTFALEAGESLGLVGPTAAGKTTLGRLLVGNLRPLAGAVRLDGAEIGQWNSEQRSRYIGYVPQDIELFSGTVGENIARMGQPDPDAVVEAAKLAHVHDMILKLPDGYDTQIGDGGATLSGGQRQRVALARAIYGEPRLAILDEPNANLDSQGESALLETIKALKEKGVTVIVIAHRPSVLRFVDKIMVLRNGAVEKFGLRDETINAITGPDVPQSGAKRGTGANG